MRPTVEGLGHATDCLESLAWRCSAKNENGYHQLASLLDLLLWLDTELEHHRQASVYNSNSEPHTIGRHGLNRPTESRLDWGTEAGRTQRGGQGQPPVEPNDKAYRDLRKLQRNLLSTLTSINANNEYRAGEIGGWPHRSSQDVGQTG